MVAAGVASALEAGGAVASGGADIAKAVNLPKKQDQAERQIDKEIEEYKVIVMLIGKLHVTIKEMKKMKIHPHTLDKACAGVNAVTFAVDILELYSIVSAKLARPVIKATGQCLKAGTRALGTTLVKTGGKSTVKAIGKSVGKALPLLSFGFAVWDTVETAIAGVELYQGPHEEHNVRKKVLELKEEANRIVIWIYNHFAAEEMFQLPLIFPRVRNR